MKICLNETVEEVANLAERHFSTDIFQEEQSEVFLRLKKVR